MANDEQLDPVEQVFLHAYPNPNRVGCPGDTVIRGIAQGKLSLDDPAREHLAHCSPCYAEFKQFQRQESKRHVRMQVAAGIAAALLLSIITWSLLSRNPKGAHENGTPPREIASPQPKTAVPESTVAVLNLEGLSSTRGINGQQTKAGLQRLPRKPHISLSIYLPVGSDEGRYEVRLLRNVNQIDKPVRVYQGDARIREGLTILPITVDLSSLDAGMYDIAFRRSSESWHFGKVVLD